MSRYKNIFTSIYIALMLLFNIQAYSVNSLDQGSSDPGKFKSGFYEAGYNSIASSDQRQQHEKAPGSFISIAKIAKKESKELNSPYLITVQQYFSNSKTLIINLTPVVIIFPFHFFD